MLFVKFIQYLCVCGAFIKGDDRESLFELSVIHINDFHDRYEETNEYSGSCQGRKSCVGGFSRNYAAINSLKKSFPNAIVLNAADNFQGTSWYSYYKWNVTQHFFNLIPFDAYTIGNHEFDDGIEGLKPFLEAIKAPVVVSNIDAQNEPGFDSLYNKSVVIERHGKRIGIIGVITKRTNELSSSGNLKFLDESKSVNNEAERLVAEENVDTIIVLSHCGYHRDIQIARNASPKIGLIVGGHSHILLYTGEPVPGPDLPAGPYPTIIEQSDGRKVLIVQAAAYGKYLGNITVQYNQNGDILSWSGAPLYLNSSFPQDEEVNQQLEEWAKNINTDANKVLGETKVLLNEKNCAYSECNVGNFVADSMVDSYLNTTEENAWAYAAIALLNGGTLRITIPKGKITKEDVSILIPFQNTLNVIEIQGKYLKEFMEHGAGHANNTSSFHYNFLQVSGMHVVYNVSKPIGSRVHRLMVRCRECDVPRYEDVKDEDNYRIVLNSFIAAGKMGYDKFLKYMKLLNVGELDVDALTHYIVKQSPIAPEIQGRIIVLH